MNVTFLTGTRLDRLVSGRKPPRPLLGRLAKELHAKNGRIILLSGPRQTGKTTLLLNAMAYMGTQDCLFILASPENSVDDLCSVITARKRKFVFVDDATLVRDLLANGHNFHTRCAGHRVCLAGADTLMLDHLARKSLLGKSSLLSANSPSFPEYMRMTGEKDIRAYMETGGIMGHTPDIPFAREYIRQAFRLPFPLPGIYDREPILAGRNLLLSLHRDFFHEILCPDFMDEDMSVIINNAHFRGMTQKSFFPVKRKSLDAFFRENQVTESLASAIHGAVLKEARKNRRIPEGEEHLSGMPGIVEELGRRIMPLTEPAPCLLGKERMEQVFLAAGILRRIPVLGAGWRHAFVQPFLRFYLSMDFLRKLLRDRSLATPRERKILRAKLADGVRNMLLKDIVLLHLLATAPDNLDIFALKNGDTRYDLVILDRETDRFSLFDIRNSVFPSRFQSRRLRDDAGIAKAESLVGGSLSKRGMIYAGPTREKWGLPYISVTDFLTSPFAPAYRP